MAVSDFGGSLDYGVACGFAFGYAGTSRSTFARDDKSFGWADGYAFGFSRHMVASTTIVTTAHARIEYITISQAVCSE